MIARPSYRSAVAWIALNDEPDESDWEIVAEMISVLMIADLWEKAPAQVAYDVVKYRESRR